MKLKLPIGLQNLREMCTQGYVHHRYAGPPVTLMGWTSARRSATGPASPGSGSERR
jgi:hypothetical protein